MNGASCGADGLSLDGIDDISDVDVFDFGRITFFDVYVEYDSFNSYSRVFDFGSGKYSDNVMLGNHGTTSTTYWLIRQVNVG